MSISLVVNGDSYSLFSYASVHKRLDALCDEFSFAVGAADISDQLGMLPFKGGERCEIYIDAKKVLTGTLEIVNASYNASNYGINISGRDLTSAIVDSSLDAMPEMTGAITLKTIIQKVIDQLGVGISVVDNAEPEPFNVAEDIISPEPGENAYGFIEKLARKRQVLLSSDADGNVVISTSEGTLIDSPLRCTVDSNSNNILSGDISYDQTGRFNRYKVFSELNMSAADNAGDVPTDKLIDQSGVVVDADIPVGRQHVFTGEVSSGDAQCINRAKWEANIRKARGKAYAVSVENQFDNNGDIWDTNTLVSVVDVFANINSLMLINTVDFTEDRTTGEVTTIGLLPPKTYTLDLEEDKLGEVQGEGLES